jgi:hypothetical protein
MARAGGSFLGLAVLHRLFLCHRLLLKYGMAVFSVSVALHGNRPGYSGSNISRKLAGRYGVFTP